MPGGKERRLHPDDHPPVDAGLVALIELVLDDRALALEVGVVDAGQRAGDPIGATSSRPVSALAGATS